MARPRKAKSVAATKLAEALNFIAPATGEAQPYQLHARVAAKWITASNGRLTAGHPVEEEMALCPHVPRLIDALNRAGTTLALTERENGQLLVAGDKIKATVPCIPGDEMPPVMPDPKCATIDDRVKQGFAMLLPLTSETGERVVEVSILLRANSMVATNGTIIFEYWHGIDLPPGLVIPKATAAAVAASSKKLEGFGFSRTSVTFYFEDGAWYKAQMFGEEWPAVDHLFEPPHFPADTPAGLFEAVRAIESFSADGALHFHEDKLKTTYDSYGDKNGPTYGATYDVPGLQPGHSFDADLLMLIEPVCQRLDYTTAEDRAWFYGDGIRGCIMKLRKREEIPPPAPAPVPAASGWGPPNSSTTSFRSYDVNEDDVPF